MFSVDQKRHISNEVQRILRETNHPELPASEIQFALHVDGAESWSWADIRNNGAVSNPTVNPWNESQAVTRTPSDAAVRDVESLAKEIAANFVVDINDLSQTTEFIAAIITKHLAARTGETETAITKEGVNE